MEHHETKIHTKIMKEFLPYPKPTNNTEISYLNYGAHKKFTSKALTRKYPKPKVPIKIENKPGIYYFD